MFRKIQRGARPYPDYAALAALIAIVLGTSIIAGIVYTYDLRQQADNTAVSHLACWLFVSCREAPGVEGRAETRPDQEGTLMSGAASVYDRSAGVETANGQRLDENSLSAAHRTLPFGTMVRVRNNQNGRTALVRINDRGPFVPGRVIDLTPAGARALGFSGIAEVTLAPRMRDNSTDPIPNLFDFGHGKAKSDAAPVGRNEPRLRQGSRQPGA
jgi:rare lipoprotein A